MAVLNVQRKQGAINREMIQAHNIVKTFPLPDGREKRAVDELAFSVARGEIYGLLGPNGAGKTTTLRILSGLIQPTSGRAVLNGHDVELEPQDVKHCIGFLTSTTGLYQRLSPRELLEYFADLHGLDRALARRRVAQLVDWLQMDDFCELRCGSLSTGQRQRTSIARSLIADPPILIMDEPTLGLDVLTNRLILDFIRKQRTQGKTILLSTHYLDEAEMLCDRIGLLHRGRLIAEGDLESLRARVGRRRLTEIFLRAVQGELAPMELADGQV